MRRLSTALLVVVLAMAAMVPVALASSKPYFHCPGSPTPDRVVRTLIPQGRGLVQPTIGATAASHICND